LPLRWRQRGTDEPKNQPDPRLLQYGEGAAAHHTLTVPDHAAGVEPSDYEIIVVDNGSTKPQDAEALQHVIHQAEREGLVATHSLSGEAHQYRHPLINGPLGKCLDHLKGPRKVLGRSPSTDLMTPCLEKYWVQKQPDGDGRAQ
jgi:hypothetical protein